jgi:thiamine-phosphate pyrophosphorylase
MDTLARDLLLVAVTDDRVLGDRDWVRACVQAVEGGATMVQVRAKRKSAGDLAALTREILDHVSVPVIVNDRLDVALGVGAAGVHVGADDLPVDRVRAVVPVGFIVGASVGDEAEAAEAARADYWGVGPWRDTSTKDDAGRGLGPMGFGGLAKLSGGRPVVALGGIRPEDQALVRRAGGVGVAVVSGIFAAADIVAAARSFRSAATAG